MITLQETKLSTEDAQRLKANWIGQVLCSPAVGKRRGVITLVNKNSRLTIQDQHADMEGRLLVTSFQRGEERIHIANIYGPNTDDVDFWEGIADRLRTLPPDDLLIVAGDFNQVMDQDIDRQPQRNRQRAHTQNILKALCTKLQLSDPWRLQHPDTRDYTFYSHPHNSYSRIDYILMSSTHLIDHTEIAAKTISDHSHVSLTLNG